MRREEYKLHSNNFTNTLLDTLKQVIPPPSTSLNNSSDLRKLNDVWASKLKSTRIVEASIFRHLHSELANIAFVSPITQQHTNKCKSFLTESQASLTNETFYLGRLLEFRKLPHLKDLREASGKKSSTPTKSSPIVDSGQDMFETLIQSFEAAELYSKQSKVMTNDQLEKQIRFFTSLISKYVKTQEEKDKLNNLIHSPAGTTNESPSPKDTRNVFNDVNRVPISSSCPSLGPNNRVHLSLIPQMAELSINTMSPTKSKQVFEPYFHSKELKLSVAGENSKNVLEFKTHLRRVIYQCFSDLASSYEKEKENIDDVRSLGVLFDRNRVYLFEFILTRKFISNNNNNGKTSQSSLPTILIDAVGVNYTNGGQGMALIFTTLLQYLRDGWKMLKETSDPLSLLHLSLLKFVYQQAKREITTSSSSNLSNNSVIATSLHSKSTSDLSGVCCSEPQVLSPSYSPSLSAANSIGSLLFSAVNNSNSTISPVRSNAFTSSDNSTNLSSPPSSNIVTGLNQSNTMLSDNAFLTYPHVNSNSLDLSNISSPPPQQQYGLVQSFGSPTNCKSSALSAEQQKAINSIAIVSRTASTKTTSLGQCNSTGNLFSSPPNHHSNNNNTNSNIHTKRMLSPSQSGQTNSSASTSSLPTSSTSGGNASTKGMRLLQRSKAILSDATNFNYFDKFKSVVSPVKEQPKSSSGGGIRELMKGRKPLIE